MEKQDLTIRCGKLMTEMQFYNQLHPEAETKQKQNQDMNRERWLEESGHRLD